MRRDLFGTALLALATCLVISLAPSNAAFAQARSEAATATDEASIRARMNQWTVGLAAGLPDGGFVRFASEMARTMDDGDNMRLIPMVTRGTTTNIVDLLYLRGVDVAIAMPTHLISIRSKADSPTSAIEFATLCGFSSRISISTRATSSNLSRT
jgi:hypothetical protein